MDERKNGTSICRKDRNAARQCGDEGKERERQEEIGDECEGRKDKFELS